MIVDSHQHFWKLSRGDYEWMSPEFKKIYRDFSPSDLEPLIEESGVTNTIIVQAAATIEETQFMLNIANQTSFVSGIVGWVNFESTNVENDIDQLSLDPLLKGFRPMIHDISDKNWMLRDSLRHGLNHMITKNLSFDALVRPHHLPNLYKFAKKYSELPIVIDHIAKPKILSGEIDQWKVDMKKLSQLPNIVCKLSGVLTEVGEGYKEDLVVPYIDFIFETFEPKRLMWGSDWPVLNMVDTYGNWFELSMKFCNGFSKDEKKDIFCNTARAFYRI